ncbi:MAG: zinc ribbon domain-containing protein [Desulfobacteraceae bacterium]|nr:MAG: zinc ribbon domain-containing protein [Desulfobacteraceae bacterium]
MPIYEYECESCGSHKEALQRFSDSPLTQCDKCQGSLKRLISQSSFHLKGTGWYVTDYASRSGNGKVAGSAKEKTPEGSKETPAASKDGGTGSEKAE